MWCKTLCKNFDMLSHKDRNGKLGLFCSVCCTTSYKVKQAGLTGTGGGVSFAPGDAFRVPGAGSRALGLWGREDQPCSADSSCPLLG